MDVNVSCLSIQIGLPVEVASDRGEGRDGASQGLQPEAAREYTSGTRGRPLSVHGQFRCKFYASVCSKRASAIAKNLYYSLLPARLVNSDALEDSFPRNARG